MVNPVFITDTQLLAFVKCISLLRGGGTFLDLISLSQYGDKFFHFLLDVTSLESFRILPACFFHVDVVLMSVDVEDSDTSSFETF